MDTSNATPQGATVMSGAALLEEPLTADVEGEPLARTTEAVTCCIKNPCGIH